MKAILVINSGSSTIKFSLFSLHDSKLKREYRGMVDRVLTQPMLTIESCQGSEKISSELVFSGEKTENYKKAIEYILRWFTAKNFEVVAAGHRIVHGGPKYWQPIILNQDILAELLKFTAIMPLHQPHNVKGVEILMEELPGVMQVGCFDTGFHATCNPIAQQYALPKRFTDDGIRRYGFHGLSYEYIADQLPNFAGEKANGKYVVAHIGNGCTMCAIDNRKSVATSIGFTGLGGLPMGTRCDSLDPGTVLYLLENYNLNTDQLRNILYRESGLLGVSGFSSDMRELLASDKPAAKLAVDIFVHRVSVFTGSLAAELQGIDGFVFTAGIGENSAEIRSRVCRRLAWLGFDLDEEKNQQRFKVPTEISKKNSKVSIWVVPTDEESMLAKHVLRLFLNSVE